jgi:alpha-L-fucosidase 2
MSVSQRTASDNQTLTFVANYPNGFSFGAVGSVAAVGGQISTRESDLVVEGADEMVMQVRLFVGEDPNTAISRLVTEYKDKPTDFGTAFSEHSALHGLLFNKMTLELDQKERQSNEEMLMTAYDGDVPASLIQTMFEFGRYLLICSSRPGSWPANLQGIWNGDYFPAWNSDFHTDENIQMNYWQALPGGLQETALPLFDYFEKWIDDYRENATKIFGCRGILLPIAQTTHGREHPCVWSNWTAAAGWIGQHFYDYYLFTGDLEFLRNRAVPWLKEVALFYEDFLVEGDDGRLLFSPSVSPENTPTGRKMHLVSMNATMDVAVCREVLQNLCTACELLGIEQDCVQQWRTMLARLPQYAMNEDGAIMEWLHPAFKDNYHHRHQSHLYPLFPGLEITGETHPELYEACRVAVEKRLVIGLASQVGWSMAHMANIYARLGMGNRALECLEILSRSSVGPNLFTYINDWRDMGLSLARSSSPPFQIDANFGITAAILEMLVFSKPGLLKLVPALPDKWMVGRATGIACRGGIIVDVEWDMQKGLFRATLLSGSEQRLLIHLPRGTEDVTYDPEQAASPSVERGTGYWDITLHGGVPLHIYAPDRKRRVRRNKPDTSDG